MDDLLHQVRWNEDGSIGKFEVHSRLFGRSVPVSLFTDSRDLAAGFKVNDTMKQALVDFMALDAPEMEGVAELLFEDCRDSFESISYGVDVFEGETMTQANHRDFGIHTAADALAKSELRGVRISGETFANRYFSLLYETPWGDLQHVVLKNGRLLTVYQDGVWFGQFDQQDDGKS